MSAAAPPAGRAPPHPSCCAGRQGGTSKAEAKVTSTWQGCDSNPTFRFSVIPSPTDGPQPRRFCSFVPESGLAAPSFHTSVHTPSSVRRPRSQSRGRQARCPRLPASGPPTAHLPPRLPSSTGISVSNTPRFVLPPVHTPHPAGASAITSVPLWEDPGLTSWLLGSPSGPQLAPAPYYCHRPSGLLSVKTAATRPPPHASPRAAPPAGPAALGACRALQPRLASPLCRGSVLLLPSLRLSPSPGTPSAPGYALSAPRSPPVASSAWAQPHQLWAFS